MIESFLINEGYRVKTFENGDSLLEEFNNNPADLVILDIMMSGTDGLTICSRIRSISNIPIIIVSAKDSEIDRITGISIGSDDYLTKPFSPIELVVRIKAIFRRMQMQSVSESENIVRYSDLTINMNVRSIACDDKRIDLTPTELLVVEYLIRNKDRAVSREELLKNVWKYDFDVDTRATDDIIKRLRKKLAAAGSKVRIDTVWGFGFRILECEQDGENQT